MSATEDRAFADVTDKLAKWTAVQDGTASKHYPDLPECLVQEIILAQIAIARETGVAIERGSRAYDALLTLARKAFNEGHDLTRDVERGSGRAQRGEVYAAMHHAGGRATQAYDTIAGLIASATAIKFTTPREFDRIMKELRHAIWQYAEARARHEHMYHCLYHPGDPLRWSDHEQHKEYERRIRASRKK